MASHELAENCQLVSWLDLRPIVNYYENDLKVKSPIFFMLNVNSSTGVSNGIGPSTSATSTSNIITILSFFHQDCEHHLGFAGGYHGDSWKRKNPIESHFVAKLQSTAIILTLFFFSSLPCCCCGGLTALELLEFALQLCFESCVGFRKLPKLTRIQLRGYLTKLIGLFLKP